MPLSASPVNSTHIDTSLLAFQIAKILLYPSLSKPIAPVVLKFPTANPAKHLPVATLSALFAYTPMSSSKEIASIPAQTFMQLIPRIIAYKLLNMLLIWANFTQITIPTSLPSLFSHYWLWLVVFLLTKVIKFTNTAIISVIWLHFQQFYNLSSWLMAVDMLWIYIKVTIQDRIKLCLYLYSVDLLL